MITSSVYEITLEEWLRKNDLTKNKSIYITFPVKQTPYFSSYDAWKTASNEDYYTDKTIECVINVKELKEYLRDSWEENEKPDQADEIYILFNYAYHDFIEEKRQELIQDYELKTSSDYERW